VCNVLLHGGDELTNCTCTYNVVTPPSSSPCYTVGHSSRLFLLLFFLPTKQRAHNDSSSFSTCHYFYVLNRHHLRSSVVIDFHDYVLYRSRKHILFTLSARGSTLTGVGRVNRVYFTQTVLDNVFDACVCT